MIKSQQLESQCPIRKKKNEKEIRREKKNLRNVRRQLLFCLHIQEVDHDSQRYLKSD